MSVNMQSSAPVKPGGVYCGQLLYMKTVDYSLFVSVRLIKSIGDHQRPRCRAPSAVIQQQAGSLTYTIHTLHLSRHAPTLLLRLFGFGESHSCITCTCYTHLYTHTHICCILGAYKAALQGVKCLSDALIAGERREAF